MAATNKIYHPFIVWDDMELSGQSAKMDSDAMSFGIRHTFTLIEKDVHGTHYYHFANNQESRATNQIYLTNLDLLKAYISYFKEKMKSCNHLSEAYNFKFTLDQNDANYHYPANLILPNEKTKLDFLSEIGISNVKTDIFRERISTLNISSREKECLYLWVRGKSTSHIAKELNLSNRTIASYLINIKNKLNASTKIELIDKVFSYCLSS